MTAGTQRAGGMYSSQGYAEGWRSRAARRRGTESPASALEHARACAQFCIQCALQVRMPKLCVRAPAPFLRTGRAARIPQHVLLAVGRNATTLPKSLGRWFDEVDASSHRA